jgi:hypothetical protein
MTMDVKS